MVQPLGVFPSASGSSVERDGLTSSLTLRPSNESPKRSTSSRAELSPHKSSPSRKTDPPKKASYSKKHQKSLSSKATAANKRARAGSSPTPAAQKTSFEERPESTPLGEAEAARSKSFAPSSTSFGSFGSIRPRHIPILIPNYVSLTSENTEAGYTPLSTWISSDSDRSSASEGSRHPSSKVSGQTAPSQPRHVEIKIPSWAQPVLKHSETPPRVSLRRSIFIDAFGDIAALSDLDMSQPTPDPTRTNTMDSVTRLQAGGLYANAGNSGSRSYLTSANSSQSSLVGQRDEDESASEAESTANEDESRSHTPSQSAGPAAGQGPTNSGPGTSNLSGLVCNVHRTTGREPHPLVGATTTVLGDKLYVFGGRRLSRNKPQLTANLYELDLVRRHWTKLDVKGDIPPPRYFHSVCTLGDTKLVCYGGMSPSSASAESTADAQPEVTVMSDVHIFDVPTKRWMKISTPDAPQGRYAHCAAILPSSAVFSSALAPMSAVHHNPSGSNPNQGTLGVSIDGTGGAEMVVVGGQDSANHYIEQVSVFNLRSLKWTGTTGMGRSCGAYRSVVTALTSMSASQIGAGPHARADLEEDDDEPAVVGSGAPMLIYSNYNFLDVKLELQVRLPDGTLTEKMMQTAVSPPGLRFPNGGIIGNHFVVSGTFLTSSKQEYALWTLDLRTLSWSRIDAGGSIFSQGSWNRGVLWSRRNAFVILGNRKRSLVDDYNNRRINFTNMCLVELETYGLYDNPRKAEPSSDYVSASSALAQADGDLSAAGRQLAQGGEELGTLAMAVRELADMDFLAIDGTRIPVNSRLVARRWGPHFNALLKDSLAPSTDNDTATLRPGAASHTSRNSSITITPSVNSGATTVTATPSSDLPDARSAPPGTRPRLLYLPHTAPTLHTLLHYLYTSTLPTPPSPLATPQMFCSLLQLARPYKIDGLLEAVVERLHECIDSKNSAAIFNASAMAAGGGEGVHFAPPAAATRESMIPPRGTSLASMDGVTVNGAGRGGAAPLRIDTEMANGRSTRNTLRPGEPLAEDSEDEVPNSAATDASLSEEESSLSAKSLSGRADKDDEIWNGALSAVVGIQKRSLRGLMEGRRLRERGRNDAGEGRARLGIA